MSREKTGRQRWVKLASAQAAPTSLLEEYSAARGKDSGNWSFMLQSLQPTVCCLMCVSIWGHVCVPSTCMLSVWRWQKKKWDPLQLESINVCVTMWVSGAKPRSLQEQHVFPTVTQLCSPNFATYLSLRYRVMQCYTDWPQVPLKQSYCFSFLNNVGLQLRQDVMYSRLSSNSLCSWNDLEIHDPPAYQASARTIGKCHHCLTSPLLLFGKR